MAFACGVGKGKDNDTSAAARQAALACRDQLGSAQADLLLVFMSSLYSEETALKEIRDVFPGVPLLGCSAAGEISSEGPDERSMVLAACAGLKAELAFGGNMAHNAHEAGSLLGSRLASGTDKLALLFCDGLAGDGAAVLRGIVEQLRPDTALVGGAAGDDAVFQSTDLYLDDQVLGQTVIGAGLQGDFHFGIGVQHGWEPVGLPVKATRSVGIHLHEINGLPAIRLYEEYFGAYTDRLRAEKLARLAIYYPLGYSDRGEYLLRTPVSVEKDGALRFTAEIPAGTAARLMIGSVEDALNAARRAAQTAVDQMRGTPIKLAVVINGLSRRRMFGPKAPEEIKIIQNVIGADVPIIGFYSYGEMGPLGLNGRSLPAFHNETVVVLTLG